MQRSSTLELIGQIESDISQKEHSKIIGTPEIVHITPFKIHTKAKKFTLLQRE